MNYCLLQLRISLSELEIVGTDFISLLHNFSDKALGSGIKFFLSQIVGDKSQPVGSGDEVYI